MAKGGLRVSVEDETYEINFDDVTLGEAEILKERFGLPSLHDFNIFDPNQLVGVLYVAVKRAHEDLDDDEILEKVRALPNGAIMAALTKQVEEARRKAANPRKAAAKDSRAASRSSATTRKRTGGRSTSASTE